jgi:hypothetical protein
LELSDVAADSLKYIVVRHFARVADQSLQTVVESSDWVFPEIEPIYSKELVAVALKNLLTVHILLRVIGRIV